MSEPLPPLPAEPRVTVIVPSFNQGAYLDDAIQSVLKQDYTHVDVWVVDGGSRDGTLDVLRGYDSEPRVQWLSEPDRGYADAVNKGLERAEGHLVGIQSSDDFCAPGAIRQAVEQFRRHPDLALVSGTFWRVDHAGKPIEPYDALHDEQWLTVEQCARTADYPCQSACLFRADLARAVGGCDIDVDWVADHDLMVRIMAAGARQGARTLKLNRVWAYVRRHPGQRNQDRFKFKLAYVRAAEKYDRTMQNLFTPHQRRLILLQAYRGEYLFRTRQLGQGLRAWPSFARYARHQGFTEPPWRYLLELPWLLPLGVGRRAIQALGWRLAARGDRGTPAAAHPESARWFAREPTAACAKNSARETRPFAGACR
ncbi:MAG: glycosyltransferase [Phycisphaerales bacterium]|nr:MAG: glycosyltransferase [Phycisphaerales bacterium]